MSIRKRVGTALGVVAGLAVPDRLSGGAQPAEELGRGCDVDAAARADPQAPTPDIMNNRDDEPAVAIAAGCRRATTADGLKTTRVGGTESVVAIVRNVAR